MLCARTMIGQFSRMFFITKHHGYSGGLSHSCHKKLDPLKEW